LSRKARERFYENLVKACAWMAVIIIVLIAIFVFWEGAPAMLHNGIWNFISSTRWHPLDHEFGVLTMIVGSIFVTLGAMILGVPFSLGAAIFLAEIAPRTVQRIVRPAIELLAGIPSVVYGLFGMTMLVPLIRKLECFVLGPEGDPRLKVGYSVLAASIILAIMILPTVTSIAEDAIRAVSYDYREGSLALGATHWQTIWHVVLPAAKSGIVAAVVLGMGRAIGETMAVIMVAGNSVIIPTSIFSPLRTLTGNIAVEAGYATGLHESALFGSGVVLFVFIFFLELIVWRVRKGGFKDGHV